MIQLNITSLTELCHLFLPAMVSKGEGGVINIGSSASFLSVPYAAVYSATKAYEAGDTCERVTQETLDAFLKNKHYIVPGKGNSKFAFLPRILSRATVKKITGDTFKKHTAN